MKKVQFYFSLFIFLVNLLFANLFITEGIEVSAIFSYLYIFLMLGYLVFIIFTFRYSRVK